MVGWGHWGWGGGTEGGVGALGWYIRQGMGFQTGDGVPVGFGVPDWGWGPRQEMGFQTWGWGSRHGNGIPNIGMEFQSGMGFQTGDGVQTWGGIPDTHRAPDMGLWGTRQMMGCQPGVGYNICESPKWNSSLLDFYLIVKDRCGMHCHFENTECT